MKIQQMPELAELKIASEFVDVWSFTRGTHKVQFTKLEKSEESKVKTDLTVLDEIVSEDGSFALHSSTSRGKEMMLRFSRHASPDTPLEEGLLVTLGMSGNWLMKCVIEDKIHELEPPKHSHLRLWGEFQANASTYHVLLVMVDPRRFAKWKWSNTFSLNRSPDPVSEHSDFKTNFDRVMMTNPKLRERPLLDVMMNQSIMNGIGNYLRSEILHKAGVNPFIEVRHQSDKGIRKVLNLCKKLPMEAYQLGGGQLKTWVNGNGVDANNFKEWMQAYQKGEWVLDQSNRKFWFDPKWKESDEYKSYAETAAELKRIRDEKIAAKKAAQIQAESDE